MKKVAKVLIIDNDGYHLLMIRANHPTFSNDPDLPGGTIEEGEQALEAALREVMEEANISLASADVRSVYRGDTYSANGTEYSLYVARVAKRPAVTVSWEHSDFAWVNREDFLAQARAANDTYMHMVHDVIGGTIS